MQMKVHFHRKRKGINEGWRPYTGVTYTVSNLNAIENTFILETTKD